MVKALGPRTTGRGYRLVDAAEGKTVLGVTTSGAYTLDVAGRNGAAITVDGDFGPLDFTGWDAADGNGDFSRQTIRVDIIQDATGGHVFDWAATEGVWREELGDLSTIAGDTVVSFDVVTLDGGATISLEPVGLTYSTDCIWADAAEISVPAVTAGGSVNIGHNLSIVTSVGLVYVSPAGTEHPRGKHILADWHRVDPDNPASPTRIDFTDAADAGDWVALVTGKGSSPCDLSIIASEWETLTLTATAATTLNGTFAWTGQPDDFQVVWGDGTTTTPVVDVQESHTYGAAYTGPVVLRWRKGALVTKIDTRFVGTWGLNAAAGSLPSSLELLRLSNSASNISGNVGSLPRNLQDILLNGTNSTIVGSFADLPTTTARFSLSNAPAIVVGAPSDLPTGVTLLSLIGTQSELNGPASGLPAVMFDLNLSGTNSRLTGSTTDLPAALDTIRIDSTPTDLAGPASGLPAALRRFLAASSAVAISGPTSDLPSTLTEFTVNLTGSNITGPMSDLGTSLIVFNVNGTPSAITWPTSFAPSMTGVVGLSFDAASVGGLSATEVNRALVDLVNANLTPTSPRIISLDGPVNAAPDATSGGLDGLAAVTTLQGRGWNVATN